MKDKKTKLGKLKLTSFATSLRPDEMENVKGGFIKIRGRRYSYNVRWTSVDTRTEPADDVVAKNTN